MQRWHLVVWGQVQGVGLRWSVQQYVQIHNLSGWVKNLSSGAVEMEVYGMEEELNKFLEWLNNNFVITKLEKEEREVDYIPSDFKIVY